MNTNTNKSNVFTIGAVIALSLFVSAFSIPVTVFAGDTCCDDSGYSMGDFYQESQPFAASDFWQESQPYEATDFYQESQPYEATDFWQESQPYEATDFWQESQPYEATDFWQESQPYDVYSTGSYGGSSIGGYSTGGGYSVPRITPPTTFYTPTYTQPRPTYTQPPVVYTPPTTNNNCVNNSCNTNVNNVNNINNSINNSGNVATVTNIGSTPVQYYPVQYVQPVYQPVYQQPVYQQPQPYCSITITRSNNAAYGQYNNQLSTITWTSNYANSAYISPNVGSVSSYGSMTVYPVNGQVYTMTVYGNGGTATCSTPVQYVAPIVNNPAPYVSLSQIPYTGLDFGPLGNALYWLSLVTFAGAAAYLVLYFQGGMLATVGAITGNRRTTSVAAMPKIQMPVAVAPVAKVAVVEEKKAELVVSPIQPVQFNLPTASVHKSTIDSMNVKHSKAGEAPRIIITRQ